MELLPGDFYKLKISFSYNNHLSFTSQKPFMFLLYKFGTSDNYSEVDQNLFYDKPETSPIIFLNFNNPQYKQT